MRGSVAAAAVLLGAGVCSTGEGQVLRGRLLDLDTNAPIPRGVITLLRTDGGVAVSIVTDEHGRYNIVAPASGTYVVEARRIGYRPSADGPLELRVGDEWETSIHLQALPVRLDPVGVTAPAAPSEAFLRRVGFYERQKADFGHFIGRDEIEARAAKRLTDLLGSLPGVRANPTSGGLNRHGLERRGSRTARGGLCHPRVYVDGLVVIRGDARSQSVDLASRIETEASGGATERYEIALNDVVLPDDIQAIEVYRSSAQVPAQFGGASVSTQCGVIVIWTRRGLDQS